MITAEQQKAIGEICRAFTRKLDTGAKPGPFLIELIKAFPDPTPLQKKIIRETRRTFEIASQAEKPRPMLEEILLLLCSWGDTLEETDVLSHLTAITESGSYRRVSQTIATVLRPARALTRRHGKASNDIHNQTTTQE